jgi:hypothetical protein
MCSTNKMESNTSMNPGSQRNKLQFHTINRLQLAEADLFDQSFKSVLSVCLNLGLDKM